MERVFIRFPSNDMMAAMFREVSPGDQATLKRLHNQREIVIGALNERQRLFFEREGAEIFEDQRLDVFPGQAGVDPPIGSGLPTSLHSSAKSLRDVTDAVRAPKAWRRTRGAGTTIVILDQGISSDLREVPAHRRHPLDLPTFHFGEHWKDPTGHGSMCAAIAAGSIAGGGRYDGLAPDAVVLAARSNMFLTDITEIFDELMRARAEQRLSGPVVISNSYGFKSCSPPIDLPINHPFLSAIRLAVDSGFFVCFAAGNNHQDVCGHPPDAAGPNTIWGANSLDEVVCVGSVDANFTNCDAANPHVNSSRGPGQWATQPLKPDCVAPTYGEISWGSAYQDMEWWGTSGACPQVAGLAGLMLSVAPTLSPGQIASIIRSTCRTLALPETCVGSGIIDCEAAVDMAVQHQLGC